MKTYFGEYKAGPAADLLDVTVLLFPTHINIGFAQDQGAKRTLSWNIRQIEAVFNAAAGATRIRHRNGDNAELFIEGKAASVYIKEMQAELDKPWHKREEVKGGLRNTGILTGIVAVLVSLYFLLVPWLAESMAGRVGVKTEQQFGEAMYSALGLSVKEDSAAGNILTTFFHAMEVTTAYPMRIKVINSEEVNAFALPGGYIVVYTGLLKEIRSYPELAALLSHEFIHVNNKHATRSVFRKLGSKIFLRLLMGSMGSVTDVIVHHADDIKSLGYSRRLEKEADTQGLQLLMERKIDARGFANLFVHLRRLSTVTNLPAFLESHPGIDERITYIDELAKGAMVEENRRLKAIFETIKHN